VTGIKRVLSRQPPGEHVQAEIAWRLRTTREKPPLR
jgi:hypothetical protein